MSDTEFTPEGAVSELVPANLTPDAVIRGQDYDIELVWHANVLVHRHPTYPPETWYVNSSCWITPGQTFGDLVLETSSVEWVAAELGTDARSVEVLSFQYVLLEF